MKKSLKIFALAASLLQAALFSAFAANPPSDFKYELTKDNKAVKITGVRNDKAEYVIPASIEDFPVTEIEFLDVYGKSDNRLSKSCTISLPEGIEIAYIKAKENVTITLSQLPSTLKNLMIVADYYGCVKYDGTFPDKIESINFYLESIGGLKLKQSLQDFAELQNLKKLNLSNVDFIGVPNKAPFKKADMESLKLSNVNLIGNKTIYIPSDNSSIDGTNVEEIIFEEGVTKIQKSFSNNKNLKKIVLPSTLKSVDFPYKDCGKFVNCPNLTEVVVPDSLKNVKVPRIDESYVSIISGYMNYSYRDARIEDVFDTTSFSLKSRIKLQAAFGFSQ